MNTSQLYSNRTKRRRIAACISKLVAEIRDAEISHKDKFDMSNAIGHTNNSCHSEFFNECNTVGCIDVPMAHGSDYASGTSLSQDPPCDFSGEAIYLAVHDVSSENFHAAGVELDDTEIGDNEWESLNSHLADSDSEHELIECSEWTAHAVGDSDDDCDVRLRNNEPSLQEKLANWAVTYNLPHNALSDLLQCFVSINS